MYEVVSEDPYWNGVYGALFVNGLQNGSASSPYQSSIYLQAAATLKHFAAYSLGGYQSFTFDAVVSDYLWSDTYFAPFQWALTHSKPRSIMCSYNSGERTLRGAAERQIIDLLTLSSRHSQRFSI